MSDRRVEFRRVKPGQFLGDRLLVRLEAGAAVFIGPTFDEEGLASHTWDELAEIGRRMEEPPTNTDARG